MSDRLAISSTFSVLMMASYLLFGDDAAQVRLDAQAVQVTQMSAPSILPQVAILPQMSIPPKVLELLQR